MHVGFHSPLEIHTEWPIMKYACETWNIGKEEGRKIDSFEFGATGECKKSVGPKGKVAMKC